MANLEKNQSDKREIIVFITIYSISRVFLLFIPASLPDLPYMDLNLALSQGIATYPVIFFVQWEVIFSIFGVRLVVFRCGLILYEVGCLIILRKFVYRFQILEFHKTNAKAKETALISCYVFAFFPFLLFTYMGNAEIMATFYLIAGLYAYYKNKLVFASILLCIGFLTEFYPIFCLVPIAIHLLLEKRIKSLAIIVLSFLITFFICNVPFFLANPSNYFTNYFSQFSRAPQGLSIWDFIENNANNWTLFSLFDLVKISPVGLTFLLTFLTYCIFVIRYFQRNEQKSKSHEFMLVISFTLLLPLVFLSIFPRYLLFGFPICCLFINTRKNLSKIKRFFILICVVSIPFSIATLILWPNLNFTILTMESTQIENSNVYLALLVGFYSLTGGIWLIAGREISFYQIQREIPTFFELLSFNFLFFIAQIATILFIGITNFSVIFVFLIFVIGIIPILWSLKKIYSRLSFNFDHFQ